MMMMTELEKLRTEANRGNEGQAVHYSYGWASLAEWFDYEGRVMGAREGRKWQTFQCYLFH